MQYAIASEQDHEDQDEVYHYVREGTEVTLCGIAVLQVEDEQPLGMRVCESCEKASFNIRLKGMDDDNLTQAAWDLVKMKSINEQYRSILREATLRNLPICKGTKRDGPHVGIPLARGNGQSAPCPMCGDIKLS